MSVLFTYQERGVDWLLIRRNSGKSTVTDYDVILLPISDYLFLLVVPQFCSPSICFGLEVNARHAIARHPLLRFCFENKLEFIYASDPSLENARDDRGAEHQARGEGAGGGPGLRHRLRRR